MEQGQKGIAAVPIPKKLQDQRIAEGKCATCGAKRNLARSKRLCEKHRLYMKDYKRLQRKEDPDRKPPRNRCTICRQLGHTRKDCKDPRAEAIREAELMHVSQSN